MLIASLVKIEFTIKHYDQELFLCKRLIEVKRYGFALFYILHTAVWEYEDEVGGDGFIAHIIIYTWISLRANSAHTVVLSIT